MRHTLYTVTLVAALVGLFSGCADITQEYKPLYQVKPEKQIVEEPVDYSTKPSRPKPESPAIPTIGRGV
jgi:hypothetical protein